MAQYEYKVVPAPAKGVKAKGVKSAEDRFAHALEETLNELGAEGWEYQRADTLPSVERSGLTGSTTNWRHVLVFRRQISGDAAQTSVIEEEITESPQPKMAAVPEPEVLQERVPEAAEPAYDPAHAPRDAASDVKV